jgi:uncharacterized protein (DUF302 family)
VCLGGGVAGEALAGGTSVTTSNDGALRRMLARSAVVYQSLVSVSAQAPWDHELGLFVRFDAGEVLRKARGGRGPQILRLAVGNPLIMKEMAKTVPDAASYAPITILVDERADGVHLSYDSMASLIAPYGSEPALAVARELDLKIVSLLEAAAR